MNVKFRMPRLGKMPNVKRSWIKELLMTFLATTISIVFTFGTALLIEHHQRKNAKRQMAMMIIHDIDDSIKQMEQVDSILRRFSEIQLKVMEGKYSRSIDFANIELMMCNPSKVDFPETAEKIFTSNIDTWSTIGKTDFIDNVTQCYINRHHYQLRIIDEFNQQLKPGGSLSGLLPLDSLLSINSDAYVASSGIIIQQMKEANRLNMMIMGISDKDMEKFVSHKMTLDEMVDEKDDDHITDEFMKMIERKDSARANYIKNKEIMYPKGGQ